MRAMNSPGMTLVLADREGVQRIATYGFGDVAGKAAVKPEELFQIGSISKSFVANCALQLHQEGKLDLQKPDRRSICRGSALIPHLHRLPRIIC